MGVFCIMTESLYFTREPDNSVRHSYGNYVAQKRIESVGERAKLVLRTTGAILGTNPISIPEERKRALGLRKILNLESAVVGSENIEKNKILHQVRNSDIAGPYTVNADTNREVEISVNGLTKKFKLPRIQKILHNGKSVYFGIVHSADQAYLVAYSTYFDKDKKRVRKVYSIGEIDSSFDTTENLKKIARKRFLELLGYKTHKVQEFGNPRILN